MRLLLTLVLAMLVLPPAAAAGKPRRADLSVSKVSLSGGPALGTTVKLRAVVRNAGKAPARPSQLSVGLAGMRAPLARKRVARLGRGKKKTVSVAVRFPSIIAAGRYAVVVCADAAKKVKERKETNNCRRAAQRLTVDSVDPRAGRSRRHDAADRGATGDAGRPDAHADGDGDGDRHGHGDRRTATATARPPRPRTARSRRRICRR